MLRSPEFIVINNEIKRLLEFEDGLINIWLFESTYEIAFEFQEQFKEKLENLTHTEILNIMEYILGVCYKCGY